LRLETGIITIRFFLRMRVKDDGPHVQNSFGTDLKQPTLKSYHCDPAVVNNGSTGAALDRYAIILSNITRTDAVLKTSVSCPFSPEEGANFMVREQAPYKESNIQGLDIIVRELVTKCNRISVERLSAPFDQKDRVDLFAACPELTEDGGKACLVYARTTVQRRHRRVVSLRTQPFIEDHDLSWLEAGGEPLLDGDFKRGSGSLQQEGFSQARERQGSDQRHAGP
jgi:hypothetical protein